MKNCEKGPTTAMEYYAATQLPPSPVFLPQIEQLLRPSSTWHTYFINNIPYVVVYGEEDDRIVFVGWPALSVNKGAFKVHYSGINQVVIFDGTDDDKPTLFAMYRMVNKR